ncbi:glycosyltransferase family 2 protein [Azospirillum isscasi]|uniref:Glycosyltransferase family 2 protein n=1 Tax=Azospirillum isscasi TaxID=3053926 RepID=A0ABU0WM81_9PROT|nr:glycosyltransferase family 2 protein [Azospirillum isscasi]MDQ2105344.1 glycosyltransferase family 2 protein [Azospirillum isscasi]
MMIYVLLPAYNEEGSLEPLFRRIHAFMSAHGHTYRLLVCNDGSRDGTAVRLKELSAHYPLETIEHKINRGLGETCRDLMERAAELAVKGDVIVRMDCDDTHNPDVIASMLDKLEQGCDVVIASRFQPGGGQEGVGRYRAVVSRAANLFMGLFFPLPGVREYSCGFRAYRAETIARAIRFYGNDFIQLKGLGFTCTLEKLLKLKLLGARFSEVPFVLRYDRKVSPSKMITSITTLGYLIMTLLYYWPFGGWRRAYQNKVRHFIEREDAAVSGKVPG